MACIDYQLALVETIHLFILYSCYWLKCVLGFCQRKVHLNFTGYNRFYLIYIF